MELSKVIDYVDTFQEEGEILTRVNVPAEAENDVGAFVKDENNNVSLSSRFGSLYRHSLLVPFHI